MERTLVLLKPDCVERRLMGRVISRFEEKGLNIIGMTGMPALVRPRMTSAWSAPPSSLTAWQRVSLRMRPALSIARSTPK